MNHSSFYQKRSINQNTELYNEIIEHSNMCKSSAEKFHGREELIQEVSHKVIFILLEIKKYSFLRL